MFKKAMILLFFLIPCSFIFSLSSQETTKMEKNLSEYLPAPDEITGWKRNYKPEEYAGDELYLYINGGAEIYHEYGFQQVLVQDFLNSSNKSVSLELYQMNDPESAYGIYTFKTGLDGKELDLGWEGRFEGYYLNFWKGDYLITITGFDEDKETQEGILEIAKAVDNKLSALSYKKPSIIHLLPQENLKKKSIKYIQGHLGLFNNYAFSVKDIFEINEGVMGRYSNDTDLFLIKYKNGAECLDKFKRIRESFKNNIRFNDFEQFNNSFSITDEKNKQLYFEPLGRYILVILGANNLEDFDKIADTVEEKIRTKETSL